MLSSSARGHATRLVVAVLLAGCSTGRLPPIPVVSVSGHMVVADMKWYTSRIAGLSDTSCTIGWITDRSLCATLARYAVQAPYPHMRTYDAALDAARSHGSSVSDNAYALLKSNALIILSAIDTSAIAIEATCDRGSSRYVITNGNYTAVILSYRLNGAAAASITVPGISRDYQRPGAAKSAIRYPHAGGHLEVYLREWLIRSAQC